MVATAQFGPYRLDAVLSRGRSATVYRAMDTGHDDRVVALKVFDRRLSAEPEFRARFRRDAGLLSTLREPHVVPIHRHGEIGGRLYLDMRLVRGPSLAEVLRRGPLAPQRAEAIAGQIGAAVDSLRRGGLGDRPIERADVLLTGPPGRGEFVQIVGLGVGRTPVPVTAAVSPAALVSRPARQRLARPLLAVGVVLAMVAAVLATVVGVRPGTPPGAAAPPGLVATIPEPATAVTDIEIVSSRGREVLVAVTSDGGLHTWDLTTGKEVRPVVPGSAVAVATTVVDGVAVAVVRNRDTTVATYDVETGGPVGPPIGTPQPPDPTFALWAGLEAAALDGGPVAVTEVATGAQVTGMYGTPVPQTGIRSIALPTGAPVGPVLTEDGQSIDTFEIAVIDGRPVAVSIVGGTGVRARDLGTGAAVGAPTAHQPTGLVGLTTAVRDGVPVAVTGGADNTVRIWNLRTGEQVGPPLTGHTDRVGAVAVVRSGDRTVLVTTAGGYQGATSEARFWDLATGAPLGAPLTGHPLSSAFLGQSGGEGSLLVAAGPGNPITVWDPAQLIPEVTS
jgi:hypothetical protein